MEGMAEWHYNMRESARGENSFYLPYDLLWPPYMFENRIALDTLEQGRLEWEIMGIGQYVHAASRKQINVDIFFHEAPGSPDVQIPAPEGSINHFTRVHKKRVRWRGQPKQSRTPVRRCLAAAHQEAILSARPPNLPP